MKRIYLDNNASTPLDPRVAQAMSRVLHANLGNPSALHSYGRESRRYVEGARTQVAKSCGARPDEIIFTAGATEANNLALNGLAAKSERHRNKVLLSPVEHPSVIQPAAALEAQGFELVWLPVDAHGILELDQAESMLGPDVAFSSLMWVNNETGAIQPVEAWAKRCQDRDIPFHCDGVQAIGKMPVDLSQVPITALTMSAHKFHGPLGAGALFLRRDTPFKPTLLGGGQEREKRAGTENLPGIVGMSEALRFAVEEMDPRAKHIESLSQSMTAALQAAHVRYTENVTAPFRWPGTLNLRMENLQAESLLMNLDLRGIAVSVGSACSSGSLEPSLVLAAMGLSVGENLSSIRISLAHTNTDSDVDAFVQAISEIQQSAD